MTSNHDTVRYDAILIPGGGVREGGELPGWVANRLDYAAQHHNGSPIICLSAGTPHKPPPLDADGFPIFESVAAAHYLIQRGIDPAQILTETASYDTVGNAYFALVTHLIPRQFRRLIIVTSGFHMPRTQAAFDWVLGLEGLPYSYDLTFHSVEDCGLDPESLAARRVKEQTSLVNLQSLSQHITTFAAFHHWLFTEHAAYAIKPDLRQPPPPDLLKTY